MRSCRKEWITNETQICIVSLLCLDVILLPYLLFPSAFFLLRFSDLLLSYENSTNLPACSHLLSHWPTEPLHNKPLKIVTILLKSDNCNVGGGGDYFVCVKILTKWISYFQMYLQSNILVILSAHGNKQEKCFTVTTKEMYTFHDWIVMSKSFNYLILQ